MRPLFDKIKFKSKNYSINYKDHDWEIEFSSHTYPGKKSDSFQVDMHHFLPDMHCIYPFMISNEIIMWSNLVNEEDVKEFTEKQWKKIYKLKHFL